MRSRASDSRLWIGPSGTEGRPRDGSSNLPGAIPLFLAHNSRVWRKSVPVLPEFSMIGDPLAIQASFSFDSAGIPAEGLGHPLPDLVRHSERLVSRLVKQTEPSDEDVHEGPSHLLVDRHLDFDPDIWQAVHDPIPGPGRLQISADLLGGEAGLKTEGRGLVEPHPAEVRERASGRTEWAFLCRRRGRPCETSGNENDDILGHRPVRRQFSP